MPEPIKIWAADFGPGAASTAPARGPNLLGGPDVGSIAPQQQLANLPVAVPFPPNSKIEDLSGRAVIRYRLQSKWPVNEMLGKPVGHTLRSKYLTHDGLTMTIKEWSRHLGIPATRISARIYLGMTVERVLSLSEHPRGNKKRNTSGRFA